MHLDPLPSPSICYVFIMLPLTCDKSHASYQQMVDFLQLMWEPCKKTVNCWPLNRFFSSKIYHADVDVGSQVLIELCC